MSQKVAIIYSKEEYKYSKKVGGLFPLERNIKLLDRENFTDLYLDLSDEELAFYEKNIKKYLKKVKVHIHLDEKFNGEGFKIPSNMFLQLGYIEELEKYFTKENKFYCPQESDEVFLLNSKESYKKARKCLKKYIVDHQNGWVAKNINKKISLPISTRIAGTRIRPNFLTIVNFGIGLCASILVWQDTYLTTVLAGICFQFASIFDGVDGEVAKFTFRNSKFGGLLDTCCDYSIMIIFITTLGVMFAKSPIFSGLPAIIFLSMFAIGALLYVVIVITFLQKFTTTGSLTAYESKFLRQLPKDDKIVKFILTMRIIGTKDFYSLFFFFLGFTGHLIWAIPVYGVIIFVATVLLLSLNIRYLNKYAEK